MKVEELQLKLQAAQQRLDKAITLKGKYEAKVVKKEAEYNEACKTYPLNDNGWVAMNWSNIPPEVYDLSYDLKYAKEAVQDTERKIKDLTQIRDNWKTKLELQKAKDNELANVPQVVKDFVHTWRVKTEKWIYINLENFTEARNSIYKLYDKACDYSNNLTYEERKALKNEYNEKMRQLKEVTDPFILNLYSRGSNKEDIDKLLDEEESGKILDLIKRVTKVTGTITDASALRIGEQNGELNGLVIGEEGKAFVETIGAGGYNIQRFHYRVLVKVVR